MPTCLYCGKDFEHKDVLFFKRKDASVGWNRPRSQKPEELQEGEKRQTREDIMTSLVQEVETGKWIQDKLYDFFLSAYLYMDQEPVYKPQDGFFVKWGTQAERGCGKGTVPNGANVPSDVYLCEDDVEELNIGLGGQIRIISLSECCCPHCHVAFPQNYLNTSEDHICRIGMVGGPRAGKTEYITAAYQNISQKFGMYRNMGIFSTDAMTKKIADYLCKEYQEKGYIPETPMVPILPLVFAYSCDSFNGYMVIYDIPGELFTDERHDELVTFEGTLKLSDSLLFLMDSAGQVFQTLNDQVLENETSNPDENQQDCILNADALCKRFNDTATSIRAGRKYEAIGLVISKFDKAITHETLLENYRKKFTNCFNPKDSMVHGKGEGVDMNAISSLTNELKVLLDDGDISMIPGFFDWFCKTMEVKPMMFAVSTYKNNGKGYEKCQIPSSERHRLLEPLLYLMAVKKFVPSFGGGNPEEWMQYLRPREVEKYQKYKNGVEGIQLELSENGEELKERKIRKLERKLEKLKDKMKALKQKADERKSKNPEKKYR